MSIYLSHTSALEFLRSPYAARLSRVANGKPILPIARDTRAIQPTTFSELRAFERTHAGCFTKPIHILAPQANSRLRRTGITCHASTKEFPKGSFLVVSPDVFLSRPELALSQMSAVLSFPDLLALACELSGTYRCSTANPRGFLDAGPVLTARSLGSFLNRAVGMHGAKTTRRALLYLIEGSASPMETVVVLLLCLPRRLGGHGLPLPQMNGRIDVGKRARKAAAKSFYKCDLLWPEANLAVEYESDLCHTGSNSLANDSARRSALAYLGIEVVTLTKRQVFTVRELDRVAALLSKRLLPRQPVVSASWTAKRNDLHRQLLHLS